MASLREILEEVKRVIKHNECCNYNNEHGEIEGEEDLTIILVDGRIIKSKHTEQFTRGCTVDKIDFAIDYIFGSETVGKEVETFSGRFITHYASEDSEERGVRINQDKVTYYPTARSISNDEYD